LTTKIEERKERRVASRQMLRNLLAERQEMLVAYCRLAGLEPYTPDKPVKRQLEEFCQLLMDYTAFGHFELYRRIADGEERRAGVLEVAKEVYPRIAEVTEDAVAFNDKYDASDHPLRMEGLSRDLSHLGERLALRMELEDRLVATLVSDVPGPVD
jgi:regulator of sigma D